MHASACSVSTTTTARTRPFMWVHSSMRSMSMYQSSVVSWMRESENVGSEGEGVAERVGDRGAVRQVRRLVDAGLNAAQNDVVRNERVRFLDARAEHGAVGPDHEAHVDRDGLGRRALEALGPFGRRAAREHARRRHLDALLR